MDPMSAGITKAGDGLEEISWNILGQTYVPKHLTESSFSWHATLPPGTMVPPHIHPEQDEFIYMFEGSLDLKLNGEDAYAHAGDLVRLPRGIPHGIFSNGDRPVKCLFWVSPARRLYDLFWQLHKMGQADPAEIVAVSAAHEVDFLPPPDK